MFTPHAHRMTLLERVRSTLPRRARPLAIDIWAADPERARWAVRMRLDRHALACGAGEGRFCCPFRACAAPTRRPSAPAAYTRLAQLRVAPNAEEAVPRWYEGWDPDPLYVTDTP
jgi:hypothetical protein